MPERIRLGHESRIYYGTDWDGTEADAISGATFTEIKTVSDVTAGRSFESLDITSRRHGGVKTTDGGLLVLDVQFMLNIHKLEAVAIALDAANWAQTIYYYLVLNGPRTTVGSRGFCFGARIANWPEEQPIADKISAQVTLEAADAEFTYKSVVITAP